MKNNVNFDQNNEIIVEIVVFYPNFERNLREFEEFEKKSKISLTLGHEIVKFHRNQENLLKLSDFVIKEP